MDKRILLKLLDKLTDKKIMVIGDMFADEFIFGAVTRISREAPVPILQYLKQKVVPGGAANAVYNVLALGGKVHAVGVLGPDRTGEQLKEVLSNKGALVEGLFIDDSRPTTTKTRIIAGGKNHTVRQQVVRIDRESKEYLSPALEEKVIKYVEKNLPGVDAVLISDYQCGVITPNVRNQVINMAREKGKIITVDSQGNLFDFKGVTVVTPNEPEAEGVTGIRIEDEDSLRKAGHKLLSGIGSDAVLITRGGAGMALFEKDKVTLIPVSNYSEVYDVTGAGDTVIGTLTLALAAGADMEEAMHLANFAAGIVVQKLGTATTTREEIAQVLTEMEE